MICVWTLALSMLGLVWLFPASLAAQSFDLTSLRSAVVRIIASQGNSIGSGSIIKVEGRTGYILTAYHVIQQDVNNGLPNVQAELFTEERLPARISRDRVDTLNDLAVLIVNDLPSPPPPAIAWGKSSDVRVPQQVFALGHPRGGPGWELTTGTVSRTVSGRIYFSGTAVSPGNSGGPLLNTQGALVGVNGQLGEGSGRALGSDVIRPVIGSWVQGLFGPDSRKEMVLVPAGEFTMGSTDDEVQTAYQLAIKYQLQTITDWFAQIIKTSFDGEQPQHRVWVDAFYMDKYEVTVGEYKTFVQATGRQGLSEEVAKYAPGDRHPVVDVSWHDADAYCQWAGKQLPTEAQWEKAARGSDRRTYPWGNAAINGQRANYCDAQCEAPWPDKSQNDRYRYTAPVGSYELGKSPDGVYDLAGNVWEWVQDWFDASYYSRNPRRNPVNDTPSSIRVQRGGSWNDSSAYLRAPTRGGGMPDTRIPNVGFRCVVGVAAPRP